MKRLERDILLRLREVSKREPLESAISLHQFFGIDILPFAIELAKVTLMLAKELELIEAQKITESDQLVIEEKPLPLDNLDKNIICADALFIEWPKANAIIGNPPYLDARKIALEHGGDYVKKLRKAFQGVPGRADFVTYFFRKAHDELAQGGRAGLVGTNTIRQNYSRQGGLDYIVATGGTISDAVSTEVWSGEAAVHVSIVNWIKGEDGGVKRLSLQRGDLVSSPWESYELAKINSALSPNLDVVSAQSLAANSKSPACFEGQQPGHDGFRVDASEASRLRKEGSGNVIFPYLNGDELLGATYESAPRFIIDFGDRDIFEARKYPAALDIVSDRVLGDWQQGAADEKKSTGRDTGEHQSRLKTWWQLKRKRRRMTNAIEKIPRYVVCVRHTKRPIFEFLSSRVRPDSALTVFPLADDYSFGVLQSPVHFEWFIARCSTLKADFRYTSDTVFDAFPWPQKPTRGQIKVVAEAAVALRGLRRETMRKLNYSLRDLYRTLDQPGDNPLRHAHARLDAAVREAYGMADDADPLAFLLELNLACAAKEKAGEKITPPGLPHRTEDMESFVTEDCIQFQI